MFKIFRSICVLALFSLCVSPALADFTAPSKNVSNSALDSMYPKIAGADGSPNVYLIWTEYVSATEQRLYFAKSTNSGATWGAPRQLTSGGQIHSNYAMTAYSICVDAPYIHIVYNWRATDSDDWEICYLRSDDSGGTWDLPIQLTNNSSSSLYPDVAARGSYVHVAYQDDYPGAEQIVYKRITNYGAGAVDKNRQLTSSGGVHNFPKFAVSENGERVSIVYVNNYNLHYNIAYIHIYAYGAGAYESRQLTFAATNNLGPDITTSTGADGQYVYIVYMGGWPGNWDIMYKRLDSYGQAGYTTYTARLTYSTTESDFPAVDFDSSSNNVHIAFFDSWTGNNDVMYRKLPNFGGDGFTGQRVSWGTGESENPAISSAGASAYVAWMDNTSGNYEILVKYGN
jgi:hypothetical protein